MYVATYLLQKTRIFIPNLKSISSYYSSFLGVTNLRNNEHYFQNYFSWNNTAEITMK